jgi:hypothetical protein
MIVIYVYICRSKCEWSIFCLCMFPRMVEFWTSITLEPDVPKTQVSKCMALLDLKPLIQRKRYQGNLLILSNSTSWQLLIIYILPTIAEVKNKLLNLFLILCGSKFTLTIKPFILIHTLWKKPSRTN